MRVIKTGDFQRAYRSGSRARRDWLVLVAAPSALGPEHGITRLGLSIGKRASKLAVGRNRIKRLLREAFRLEYSNLPKGCDLIAICPERNPELDFEELRRQLAPLAHKAWKRTQERTAKDA